MKIFNTLSILILLSGCAATDMQTKLERGLGNIPTTQFSNAQTVEEIRQLRPQATVPLKIAVISQNRRNLSQQERDIVEQLGEKLKQIGFVRSLEFIPQSLQPTCGYRSDQNCFLNASRAAGARLGADAILFLNESAVTDAYVNPLSILNLTIVGMWVIPAHHRDSYSVYEASLFDIDNGYLYAVAEGHGENKIIRPYMYVEYGTGRDEASVKALNDISNRLYIIAQEQMKKTAVPSK
jgi:rhombotail lipoprotein